MQHFQSKNNKQQQQNIQTKYYIIYNVDTYVQKIKFLGIDHTQCTFMYSRHFFERQHFQ